MSEILSQDEIDALLVAIDIEAFKDIEESRYEV